MGGIGGIEIFIILMVALVIFGPKKLPEMGRSLGKAIREFKNVGNDLQDELTKAADEIDKEKDPNIKPPNPSSS
ncbi:MAG: twin-arginine translocase TatA/TatE family subunit [Candidatus Poribacteria bacterium]|nr:twin-arginine translocase TatA/TatE family subunit [Candidatus Poribacteria bacterium]MDD9975498.1 twin-arginine translocase TatA/TatE family subunit [Candidatus Poribacteria bacterium]